MSDVDFNKSAKLGSATSAVALSTSTTTEENHDQPEKSRTPESTEDCAPAVSWALSFDKLLADPAGVEKFTVSNEFQFQCIFSYMVISYYLHLVLEFLNE